MLRSLVNGVLSSRGGAAGRGAPGRTPGRASGGLGSLLGGGGTARTSRPTRSTGGYGGARSGGGAGAAMGLASRLLRKR